MSESMEERVTRLLLEHAQNVPEERPLPLGLSIRRDLAVESLSLVSVTITLGDELGVDVIDAGIELGNLETVGDLVGLGHGLVSRLAPAGDPAPHSPGARAP
jgi:acyl carrier protein